MPVTWSEDAELQSETPRPQVVYFGRRNASVFQPILVHAILARQPCVILYPEELRLRADYLPEAFAKHYPFIHWVPIAGTNTITAELAASIRQQLAGSRYSIVMPDLTLLKAYYDQRSDGFEDFVRTAERVTLFEEGMFTYFTYLPQIAEWRADEAHRTEQYAKELAEKFRKFRGGEIGRMEIREPEFPALEGYRFFLSRTDLAEKLKLQGFQELDLAAGWAKLQPSDRANVLEFFKIDPASIERLRRPPGTLPRLVMIGTAYFSDEQEVQLRRWIDSVYRRYSPQYELFFKPHPLENKLEDYVKAKYPGQVKLLAASTPFEIYGLEGVTFEKLVSAGFSSILLSVPPERVISVFDYMNDPEHVRHIVGHNIVSADKIFTEIE